MRGGELGSTNCQLLYEFMHTLRSHCQYIMYIMKKEDQLYSPADEGLRGRNVLVYLTLCATYTAQVIHPFAISHVAMSLYNIKKRMSLK